MDIRVILNGKKAGLEPVRQAIFSARDQGCVEVRVTWEGGDAERLVLEAHNDGCKRIIAAGGDGSVNEVVNALMQIPDEERPELAIMPLGTANDFATACGIPSDLAQSLTLAQTGNAYKVDCARANDQYFINVASGGFGAQVTTNTPVHLKNFIGGGAYTLTGVVQALSFVPFRGRVTLPDMQEDADVIVGAVCNGRQAGGGQQLAPAALLDDAMLDVIALHNFPPQDLAKVLNEIGDQSLSGEYVKRYRVPWAEWHSDAVTPVNLDGEPIQAKKIRFEIMPAAIRLVVPADCPLLSR